VGAVSFDHWKSRNQRAAMKLRFSLRTMLIFMTCAAALCWWRDRPRRLADRFVDAIAAGDYAVADALLVDEQKELVARFLDRDERNRILKAERERQTSREWINGQCRIAMTFVDFEGLGGYVTVVMMATNGGIREWNVAQPAPPVQYDIGTEVSHEIRR
jgi:hypothetical protein